jgi:hypothetical protein
MQVLAVVLHLGPKRCLVDRWDRGGPVVAEGKAGSPNVEMFQMRKGGNVPFLEGAQMVFPVACNNVVPRTSRAAEARVVGYLM